MAQDDYRGRLNAVGWTLSAIALIVVSARCYCRLYILNRFGWDDGFMVFALVSALVTTILVTVGTVYGFGIHYADITDPERKIQALKYTIIPPAISLIASTTGKISMVIFLLHLLGHAAKRIHRWFLYLITAAMIGLNLFAFIIIIGSCYPAQKQWMPNIPGKCMPSPVIGVGGRIQAIFNAFMDLVTAVFPAYMVQTLQMKRSTKWGLTFLMGGGVFAAAATIVKVVMMKTLTDRADLTYAWGPIGVWYLAEIFVLIITGSLPTLKPLWNVARGRLPSSHTAGAYYDGKGGRSSGIPQGSSGLQQLGSNKSHGAFSRKVGQVTIALEEVDNMRTVRGGGEGDSSSVESILPKDDPLLLHQQQQQQQQQQSRQLQHGRMNSVARASPSPSDPYKTTCEANQLVSPHGANSQDNLNGVQVTTEVSVDYDNRSYKGRGRGGGGGGGGGAVANRNPFH